MKRPYVLIIKFVGAILKSVGVLTWLERRRGNRMMLYLRSLFSIHDARDMIHLDIPWWTFAGADAVEQFLRERNGNAIVFEYGSGASTIWLAKRSKAVYSVEHDEDWAIAVQALSAPYPNIDFRFVEPAKGPDDEFGSGRKEWANRSFRNYVQEINTVPVTFDLIVVDGRSRSACLLAATGKLKDDGMVVLDNSHRRRYQAALQACGLETTRLRGLAPGLPYPDETTVLHRRDGEPAGAGGSP